MALPQIGTKSLAAGHEVASIGLPLGDASFGSWRVRVDPISSSPSQLSDRLEEFQKSVAEETGRTLDKLRVADLKDKAHLKSDLYGLRLNEFFDHHGSLRFRQLGLTFAAKKHLDGPKFGSSTQNVDNSADDVEQRSRANAKAFFLSTSMVEKDAERCKKRSDELYNSVPENKRLQVKDVLQRQLEVVFSEIPDCQKFFPSSTDDQRMLPLDFSREANLHQFRVAERAVQMLQSVDDVSSMGWMFSRQEALTLVQMLRLWTRFLRPGLPPLCIDRSTFCRLILDLGLVDQKKTPYYWVLSMFDKHSRDMRSCPMESCVKSSAPLVKVINDWMLVCIFDVLVRRFFDLPFSGEVQPEIRKTFLLSVFDIARHKIPATIIEESGLKTNEVTEAIKQGKEISGRPSSSKSSSSGDVRSTYPDSKSVMSQRTEPAQSDALIGHELLQSQVLLSMLLEPEVLHVVAQYQSLFQKLHWCYADEGKGLTNGHMTYAAFAQFCVDFHLSPAFVSSHFLQNAYKSSACIEPCNANDLHYRRCQSQLSSELKAKITRTMVTAYRTGELEDLWDEMEAQRNSGHEDGRSDVDLKSPRRGSMTRRGSLTKGSVVRRNSMQRRNSGSSLLGSSPLQTTKNRASLLGQPPGAAALVRRNSSSNASAQQSPGQPATAAKGSTLISIQLPYASEGASTRMASPRRSSGVKSMAAGRASLSVSRTGSKNSPTTSTSRCVVSGRRASRTRATTLSQPRKVDGPEPWATAVAVARYAMQPKLSSYKQIRVHSKFGVSAFAETLCRIAFTYLATYGNSPQVVANSHVRTVWIVSYLRCVLSNLKQSFDKRAETMPKACERTSRALRAFTSGRLEVRNEHPMDKFVHSPLRKALQDLNLADLQNPPRPTVELLAPTVLRAGLPDHAVSDVMAVQKRRRSVSLAPPVPPVESTPKSRRSVSKEGLLLLAPNGHLSPGGRKRSKRIDNEAPQAVADTLSVQPPPEKLCVVNGMCSLCQSSVSNEQWGNPHCSGCSIVDRFPFEDHLFKKLLVQEVAPPLLRPFKVVPPLQTRRHAMTPPPMGKSHALRKPPADAAAKSSKDQTFSRGASRRLTRRKTHGNMGSSPASNMGSSPASQGGSPGRRHALGTHKE